MSIKLQAGRFSKWRSISWLIKWSIITCIINFLLYYLTDNLPYTLIELLFFLKGLMQHFEVICQINNWFSDAIFVYASLLKLFCSHLKKPDGHYLHSDGKLHTLCQFTYFDMLWFVSVKYVFEKLKFFYFRGEEGAKQNPGFCWWLGWITKAAY